MFNWKRLFTDLGWAMSMTDPMCYSHYLASRLDSKDGKGTPDIAATTMALHSLRDRDRAATAGTTEDQAREPSTLVSI